MTKQEEIRKGLATKLRAMSYLVYCDCKECKNREQLAVDEIFSYLHSQGVVIKVEGLPNKRKLKAQYEEEFGKGSTNMSFDTWYSAKFMFGDFEAGYVAVETLIKEK